ncbi:MAG: GNAT family N-acetyltransferase [Acidimicrobiales bacterium]
MPIEIQRVAASATAPLRQQVLRPHQTVDELVSDDDEQAVHFAAVDHREVIGTASVRREAPAWAPDDHPSWRLRGMATADGWRGRGVGATILGAVVDHVRHHGGGRLWCNARTPAMAFYQRAGLVIRGEGWEDPVLGPHIAMEAFIEPAAP